MRQVADEDAVGLEQVVDCSSLSQEFRVGKNVEVDIGIRKTGEDLA
jgi:hypothetical protein